MDQEQQTGQPLDKSELRKQQVLDAATRCFRREGFHGSSMARISQASGMSAGHIYHYFPSKEKIVEAIAAREEHNMADLLRKVAQDHKGGSLADMLTRQTQEMVQRTADPDCVGLTLELAAEAARNPSVKSILQHSDKEISAQFTGHIHDLSLRPAGMDEGELRLRLQAIALLFNGLSLRSLGNPALDLQGCARLINAIIRFLLEEGATKQHKDPIKNPS